MSGHSNASTHPAALSEEGQGEGQRPRSNQEVRDWVEARLSEELSGPIALSAVVTLDDFKAWLERRDRNGPPAPVVGEAPGREDVRGLLDFWEAEHKQVAEGAPGEFSAEERQRARGAVELCQRLRDSLNAALTQQGDNQGEGER